MQQSFMPEGYTGDSGWIAPSEFYSQVAGCTSCWPDSCCTAGAKVFTNGPRMNHDKYAMVKCQFSRLTIKLLSLTVEYKGVLK